MLNPLIMTAVYTLVFSYFVRLDIPNYSAFLICGILPWLWFSESIISGTNCLINWSTFLRDTIFPAEVLPVMSIGAPMMNYMFALPILVVVMLIFDVTLGWSLLALPLVMAVQFLFTLGIVFILGTYNVFFHDLRNIVQHLVMAGFFLTPIMYNNSIIPLRVLGILKLNPMMHIIAGYRDVFLYNKWPNWENLGYVSALSIVIIILGFWAFESHRESFAEYL
jgi:ABC-type polysaccharide/polyol phosphate export permease